MPLTQVQSQMIGGNNSTVPTATGLGNGALNSNTAANNTGVGYQAGFSNTTGAQNTFIGRNAGYSNTTGTACAIVGSNAGYSNQTANNNTFFGDTTGYFTTGGNNTFIGGDAGYLVTTGIKNTILGRYNGNTSGFDIRTANNWVVLSDGDGIPVQVYNPNGIYYTQNGFREYKNGGFFSAAGGTNVDILIATNWTADQNIYYETNVSWNNGDGGAFSIGVIWNSFDGATTRIRKIAENNASPIPTVTFFLSGSNLYIRYTLNAGLNGYYQLYTRSKAATLNAF